MNEPKRIEDPKPDRRITLSELIVFIALLMTSIALFRAGRLVDPLAQNASMWEGWKATVIVLGLMPSVLGAAALLGGGIAILLCGRKMFRMGACIGVTVVFAACWLFGL